MQPSIHDKKEKEKKKKMNDNENNSYKQCRLISQGVERKQRQKNMYAKILFI